MLRKSLLLTALALLLFAAACSGKPPYYYQMPEEATIAVAPFTQPVNESELLAGYIPVTQNKVDHLVLQNLDDALMQIISQDDPARIVASPGETNRCKEIVLNKNTKTKTYPLNEMIQIGECMSADYILVPQLIDWHERQGGDYGAVETAIVHLNLYLIDVKNKGLVKRYYFEENQAPLSDNLLNIGRFASRGGKYLSAHDLAVDGMKQGLREFGL